MAKRRLAVSIATAVLVGVSFSVGLWVGERGSNEEVGGLPTAPNEVGDAARYAPILVYDRKEAFIPIDAGAYVRHTRLFHVGVSSTKPRQAKPKASEESPATVDLDSLPKGSPSCFEGALDCHYGLKVVLPRRHHCVRRRRKRFLCVGGPKAYRLLQQTLVGEGAMRTVYWRRIETGNRLLGMQYWFFYVFNNWRNWHEGDWEQVTVRLRRREGRQKPVPIEAAYSSHKHGQRRLLSVGDNLLGTHPVVFVARGSHANYFSLGAHDVDEVPAWLRRKCAKLPPARNPCSDHSNGDGRVLGPGDYRLEPIGWPAFSGDWGSGNFYEHGPKCLTTCFGYGVNVHDPQDAGPAWTASLQWLAGAAPAGRPAHRFSRKTRSSMRKPGPKYE